MKTAGKGWKRVWWRMPAFGVLVWLLGIFFPRFGHSENPWAEGLLVLAAMAVVPLGLDAVSGPRGLETPALRKTRRWQGLASILLLLAYRRPPGELESVLLALPWVVVTFTISLSGVLALWRGRWELSPRSAALAGYVFIGVGGGWVLGDRAGIRPLDFDRVIVLLTAVHFHYAGFALPILTGLAARRLPGLMSTLAIAGVTGGVPLVATGIVLTQLGWGIHIEAAAAGVLAAGGALVALLYARLVGTSGPSWAVKTLWMAGAASLVWSMALAALYGARAWIQLGWLDIPAMWTLHGTANAIGFALGGLLAWNLANRRNI